MIIVTEDKEAATQVKINTRKILILELIILCSIRQVNQKINDFLSLRSIRNLIQLIKVDDRIHALALNKNLGDASPCRSFICVRVTIQERSIRCSTKRNEVERAT